MEENKEIEDKKDDVEVKTISLEKYVWPDEAALKEERKKNKKLKYGLIIVLVIGILAGWLGGSLLPYGFTSSLRSVISRSSKMDSSKKIEEVLEVMESDWFFKDDIDDLDERLVDQALEGITTNDEDAHTEYMSADEMESFTQSINRNYVGIGVQYINTDGVAIVEKVYKNTPAEKAGIQPGDIIHSVDGEDITGYESSKIKELVQGESGTVVTIGLIREGENIALDITREEVSSTAYGEMLDDNIAYLQLYQFGNGTFEEVKAYLDDLQDAKGLVLDLRDNGGGYLDSVASVASCFLDNGSAVMSQVYSNGESRVISTSNEKYSSLSPIIILVNENTASAAEVLTLALKDQRDDVTIVGTTTYGKGTVQVSKQFDDGSALKYTTSKWISPNGTWVNGVGITPDEEVKLDDVFYETFVTMEDDESYTVDQVADAIENAQMCLSYLGYEVDRKDGYFSSKTAESLKQFKEDHNLSSDEILDADTFNALRSAVILDWNTTHTHDTQLAKAEEILND